MYSIFDDIKTIYLKRNISLEKRDTYQNIALVRWLAYDEDNLPYLKKIITYIWYLDANLFYYLLYCNIPKKDTVPYLHKITKEEPKENKLFDKIKETLQWTDKELKLHLKLLEKIINEEYWAKELGINHICQNR
jgi:hypothetical protein